MGFILSSPWTLILPLVSQFVLFFCIIESYRLSVSPNGIHWLLLQQGTYNDEVIRRLLVLKKLDGYPVIREVLEEEKEEEMTTLDMKEIQNMAEKLEADEVCLTSQYFGKLL